MLPRPKMVTFSTLKVPLRWHPSKKTKSALKVAILRFFVKTTNKGQIRIILVKILIPWIINELNLTNLGLNRSTTRCKIQTMALQISMSILLFRLIRDLIYVLNLKNSTIFTVYYKKQVVRQRSLKKRHLINYSCPLLTIQ